MAFVSLPPDMDRIFPLEIADVQNLKVGEDVFVIGHPSAGPWCFTRGTVSRISKGEIFTDAAINQGKFRRTFIKFSRQIAGITSYVTGKQNPIGAVISIYTIHKYIELSIDKISKNR